MKRRTWLLLASLLLSSAVAACGGEDNNRAPPATGSGQTPQAGTTSEVPDATEEAEATPTEFEALRDSLANRLDAIGASIGDTPNDIRGQLLESCLGLGEFVDPDRVEPVCQDIEDAIERGDPGKIDLVLDHLADLEPD